MDIKSMYNNLKRKLFNPLFKNILVSIYYSPKKCPVAKTTARTTMKVKKKSATPLLVFLDLVIIRIFWFESLNILIK